jgi:hypothetical protein
MINILTVYGNIIVYFKLPDWVQDWDHSLVEKEGDASDVKALKVRETAYFVWSSAEKVLSLSSRIKSYVWLLFSGFSVETMTIVDGVSKLCLVRQCVFWISFLN